MKITIKQYAMALYETVDGKSQSQVKPVIKKFAEMLIKYNQLTKIDDIINEFLTVWNREKKIVTAETISARELTGEIRKSIKKYITAETKAEEVILMTKADDRILGGVIIKYGDKVLDGSLKAKLNDLKSFLKK